MQNSKNKTININLLQEHLKRAGGTVLDQDLPFYRPDTGKIAVKVINHYGDEVFEGVWIGVIEKRNKKTSGDHLNE